MNIEIQLASILDTLKIIWHYEGNNVWTSWAPGDWGGDLTTMVDGQSYRVNMNAADVLEYTEAGKTYRYDLKAGLNDIVWKARAGIIPIIPKPLVIAAGVIVALGLGMFLWDAWKSSKSKR